MKLLEERVRKDGEVLDDDVLRINSSLNHQVDPEFMMQIGEEFKHLFENEKITKVLTCEASGIAPGTMTAYQPGVPTVFARRKKPSTLNDTVYWADVFSYAREVNNKICVGKKFLNSDDCLLIIDDFLTHGEAVKGVLNIAKQTNAALTGVGVVVAKRFQGGNNQAKEHGYRLEALTRISSFESNQIHSVGEK